MTGYIYLTTNLINNKMYIGKHERQKYDSKYYGSGKILQKAIEKYGIENFKNEILYEANSTEELNIYEKKYIMEYREKFGKNNLYNIANGGDGGDTFSGKSDKEKEDFVKRMTEINKERCSSKDFKEKLSKATSKRYKSIKEREKQSEKIKRAWSNKDLIEKQKERIQNFYDSHPNYLDNSHKYKPCYLELNGTQIRFGSIGELKQYLKEKYNYTPDPRTLKRIILDSQEGVPYKAFYKRFNCLNGMLIYLDADKSVETMGDECSPVGDEIGTSPKCKTEIEEIVQST